ncbi:MAG: RnfABCDGE type electron transport complex subunit D, partial [Porticoccaceae bacterium]
MALPPIDHASPKAQLPAPRTTDWIMRQVSLATLPGLIALCGFFGWGSLINVLLAAATAVACEALVLRLRARPLAVCLGGSWGVGDGSALLTGILLGLALPPLAPWSLPVLGAAFAIVIVKHLYGGLGHNLFNPAMAGYAMLLVAFPLAMNTWPLPQPLLADGHSLPGLWQSLQTVFPVLGTAAIDGLTGATPLDTLRHNSGLLMAQLYAQNPLFVHGDWAGVGWEWVNLGFLAGGVWLLYQRIFSWHAPVAMLAALALMALLFYDNGSSVSKGSVVFHLLSGGTLLGAFFIVTDPVTGASSARGRLIGGALTGVLVFALRAWSRYPDGIAFAVLLMNCAAPLIDRYSVPRS